MNASVAGNGTYVTIRQGGSCYPGCPGYNDGTGDCGDYTGISGSISVVFFVLCIGGQLKIFICRTKTTLFATMPGPKLLAASTLCWFCTALFSGIVDYSWGLATYASVDLSAQGGSSTAFYPILWHKAPGGVVGWLFLWCIVLMFLEDLSKWIYYLFYAIWGAETQHMRDEGKTVKERLKWFFEAAQVQAVGQSFKRERDVEKQPEKDKKATKESVMPKAARNSNGKSKGKSKDKEMSTESAPEAESAPSSDYEESAEMKLSKGRKDTKDSISEESDQQMKPSKGKKKFTSDSESEDPSKTSS